MPIAIQEPFSMAYFPLFGGVISVGTLISTVFPTVIKTCLTHSFTCSVSFFDRALHSRMSHSFHRYCQFCLPSDSIRGVDHMHEHRYHRA